MKKLTKEDILKGKEKRETLHLDSYDADIVLRPLTDGELSEIFSILGSIPLKPDGTPDVGKIDVTKNFKALRLAASLGMIEPKLSAEDVGDMKFGVPEFIGTRVLELSGISSAQGAKKKGLS
ncbi:MAG TPA: hypothetical protein HA257_07350 [Candidatus Methanoperedenaceae archaeon]|nr:hypothetical protein [Candidatus Methanoperedenaceae archaeon]